MAGVGFVLDKMARGGSLTGVVGAYSYSAFLVAGPWMVMVLAIAGVSALSCPDLRCTSIETFRSILIYNFLFAQVLAGAIALPMTRYVSDQIFARKYETIMSAYQFGLLLFAGLGAVLVGSFYVLAVELSAFEKLLAFQNFLLVGAAWITAPMLGAIKEYRTVSLCFVGGAIVMVATVNFASDMQTVGTMLAFNFGLMVVVAGMVWRLMRAYGIGTKIDLSLIKDMAKRWDLFLIGLFFNLAGWIDKVIVWWFGPSDQIFNIAGNLRTFPNYDAPMFWAQLTAIPLLAVFFVNIETAFYRHYRGFYGSFAQHASLREVESRMEEMGTFVWRSIAGLFAAAVVISFVCILLGFVFVDVAGFGGGQMGVLRSGLMGAAFHTSTMFCLIFLFYFDLRRHALILATVFLVLNIVATFGLLNLGYAYLGFGYLFATAGAFVTAIILLTRELKWLHFHAFVTNNIGVTKNAIRRAKIVAK